MNLKNKYIQLARCDKEGLQKQSFLFLFLYVYAFVQQCLSFMKEKDITLQNLLYKVHLNKY